MLSLFYIEALGLVRRPVCLAGLRGVVVAWWLLFVGFGIGLDVMDACGRLRSRGGRGFLWLVGFQKCVKDLVGENG